MKKKPFQCKKKTNGESERHKLQVVKLIPGQPKKFKCLMCTKHYTRGFRKCEEHLEGEHGLPHDLVKDWYCYKISIAIRNGNHARQEALYKILEQGLPPAEGDEGEAEEAEGAERAQPSDLPQPAPIAQQPSMEDSLNSFGTKLVNLLENVTQKIAAPGNLKAQSVEVDLPKVTIKESPIDPNDPDGITLKTWQHKEGDKAARVPCPLNSGRLYKEYTFDLSGFQKWLPRHTKVKAEQSVFDTCGNLERLCQMSASRLPTS